MGIKINKGQSLVEMALILPIIILILTGIIEFGLFFNSYLIATNASREGARFIAAGGGDYDAKYKIYNLVYSLDKSKLTITIYPQESIRRKGESAVVTINYNYSLLTPIISAVLPNPLKIQAKTIMRVE